MDVLELLPSHSLRVKDLDKQGRTPFAHCLYWWSREIHKTRVESSKSGSTGLQFTSPRSVSRLGSCDQFANLRGVGSEYRRRGMVGHLHLGGVRWVLDGHSSIASSRSESRSRVSCRADSCCYRTVSSTGQCGRVVGYSIGQLAKLCVSGRSRTGTQTYLLNPVVDILTGDRFITPGKWQAYRCNGCFSRYPRVLLIVAWGAV
jgi:hypothetical protein